ncbi:hypothetical protein BD560DRAFT_429290 [Blakeslea trispora]|nr:hypothetical protein BD560DRAFT_429290 [Blakeslea trispora]
MFQCSWTRYLVVAYHNLSIPFFITRFRVKSISSSHHLTISPSHHLTISPSHHLTISPSHHLTISPSHHLPDAKVDKVATMTVETYQYNINICLYAKRLDWVMFLRQSVQAERPRNVL